MLFEKDYEEQCKEKLLCEEKWQQDWDRLKLPSGHHSAEYEVGEKCLLYGHVDNEAIPVKITKLFYNGTYEVVDTNDFYYRVGPSNLTTVLYYIYEQD